MQTHFLTLFEFFRLIKSMKNGFSLMLQLHIFFRGDDGDGLIFS